MDKKRDVRRVDCVMSGTFYNLRSYRRRGYGLCGKRGWCYRVGSVLRILEYGRTWLLRIGILLSIWNKLICYCIRGRWSYLNCIYLCLLQSL